MAKRQYSVFTRSQVLSVDLTDEFIRLKTRRGLWLTLHRGVFVPTSVSVGWQQRAMGAVLACGPKAVASHFTAEVIWCFTAALELPHVTVPHATSRERDGITVHRTLHLESVGRDGFRVTPPMRTLLDLAPLRSVEIVERHLDAAHRRGLIAIRRFQFYLAEPAHASQPGAKLLRRLLAFRDPDRPIGSDLETIFFRILRAHGLPLPVKQLTVVTRTGEKHIDFAYPDRRVAIELDGFEEHGTSKAFESDRARQNELEELGWTFRRFTWKQSRRTPTDVAITVGRALGLRPSRWKPRR